MRLWSLHPSYLDAKGLVALWREGLLAQKVLMGQTKGYKHHPQLNRFKEQANPKTSIAFYLKEVCGEAEKRGYSFNENKIAVKNPKVRSIKVSSGQIAFEMQHLLCKLKQRDPHRYTLTRNIKKIKAHPLFRLTQGKIADWERVI